MHTHKAHRYKVLFEGKVGMKWKPAKGGSWWMWLKVKSSRTGVGQLFTVSSRGMAARRTLRGTWARAIEKEGREMCECEQTMPVTDIRVNFTVRLRIMVHLKIRFC